VKQKGTRVVVTGRGALLKMPSRSTKWKHDKFQIWNWYIQDGCHTFCQNDVCTITQKLCNRAGSNLVYGLPSRCSTSLLKCRSPRQNPRWPPWILSKQRVCDNSKNMIRNDFKFGMCIIPSFPPNMASNTILHILLCGPRWGHHCDYARNHISYYPSLHINLSGVSTSRYKALTWALPVGEVVTGLGIKPMTSRPWDRCSSTAPLHYSHIVMHDISKYKVK
jgi:hypothetical protein